jgi:hypothetical protein
VSIIGAGLYHSMGPASTHVCQIIFHVEKLNISEYSKDSIISFKKKFFFAIYFCGDNFNISTNNIISVEVAKVYQTNTGFFWHHLTQ